MIYIAFSVLASFFLYGMQLFFRIFKKGYERRYDYLFLFIFYGISLFVAFCVSPVLSPNYLSFWFFIILFPVLVISFKKIRQEYILIVFLFLLAYIATSGSIFYSKDYQKILGTPTILSLQDDNKIKNIVSNSSIRIVDEKSAYVLAGKAINNPKWGKKYIINKRDMSIQKVNGKLYWVAPMSFYSVFKWFLSESGTPGYIMVSSTDPGDVQVITEDLNHKKISIRYFKNSFRFFKNIYRHLYFNGLSDKKIMDATLEIDDSMRPWWVVSIAHPVVGMGGFDIESVAIVDPDSGKFKIYKIGKIPSWVDRVFPEKMIKDQINWWGEYVGGWWNSTFVGAGNNIMTATEGTSLVLSNGVCYWYTGLEISSGGGSVGFMLVNTRNKKASWYKIKGTTEAGAIKSAEGIYPEKNYQTTSPILYSLNGELTYIMSLKDEGGLVKLVSMVNYRNYNISVAKASFKEAYKEYLSKMLSGFSSENNIRSSKNILKITGTVFRKALFQKEIKFILNGKKWRGKIFSVDTSKFPMAAVTYENDDIEMDIPINKNKEIEFYVLNFKNLKLSQ